MCPTHLSALHRLRADPASADFAAGADAARVALKLTIMLRDGSVAGMEEVAVHIDTATGCHVRSAAPSVGARGRVKWMAVGFDGAGAWAPLAVHSAQACLASVTDSAQRVDSDALLQLDAEDGVVAVVVVVNGQATTGGHEVHALLRRLDHLPQPARVGVLHLGDRHGAAAKHFYSKVDFVLSSSGRGAREREHEVSVPVGFGSLPVPLSDVSGPSLQPWLQDRVAHPEYVWALLGWTEQGAASAREALVAEALRYSPQGLVLDAQDTRNLEAGPASQDLLAVFADWRSVLRNAMAVLIDSCDASAVELMFEALEAGAVPVMGCGGLEERLLGPQHHVLTLARRSDAGQQAGELAASEADWVHQLAQTLGPQQELPAKRRACHAWWAQHRARLRARVSAAVLGGPAGAPDAGGTKGTKDAAAHAHERAASAAQAAAGAAAAGGAGTRGKGKGGLTEWATRTLRITRQHPPPPPPPPPPPTPPPPSRAHASAGGVAGGRAEADGEGDAFRKLAGTNAFPRPSVVAATALPEPSAAGGSSGWNFLWQAGVSLCNTYPKWHLALCDDGGMSVEECGRECVHVTPLDFAQLQPEPNQHKDLEAASMASHQQAIFGQHGPQAFGWQALAPTPSVVASTTSQRTNTRPSPPHSASATHATTSSLGPGSRGRADEHDEHGAGAHRAQAGREASAPPARQAPDRPSAPPQARPARAAEPSPATWPADPMRTPASTSAGGGGDDGADTWRASHSGQPLLQGGWDAWWEGIDADAGGDGALWRGTDTPANGAQHAGDGALLRIARPRQGEHLVCGGPGCGIPLEFFVEGHAVGAGAGSPAAHCNASLKINGRQAASFADAREVGTRLVDLPFGWHMLQIDASVSPARRAPRQTQSTVELVDARSFRVVHVLTAEERGGVSFGQRGGCRLTVPLRAHQGPRIVSCAVRPFGWTADQGWEEEEAVEIEVCEEAECLYEAAVQVAEVLQLGRIEALQIWQCFDWYSSKLRGRGAAAAPSTSPSARPPQQQSLEAWRGRRRWAVIAANSNSDYAFYLPIVAHIWERVVGYMPLVLLVGTAWRSPPPGSRHEVVVRALEQLGDKVKVQMIASDEDFNTAAVAQMSRLYACLVVGIADDDYLLTTDADLIPLSGAHFNAERNWNRSLHLYNSFCCAPLQLPEGGLDQAQSATASVLLGAPDVIYGAGVEADHRLLHLPISYAGAEARVWRQLMGLSREEERQLRKSGVSDLLRLAIESRLLNDLGAERAHMNLADNHRHADMDMWHLDQRVLSAKVAYWSLNTKLNPRP